MLVTSSEVFISGHQDGALVVCQSEDGFVREPRSHFSHCPDAMAFLSQSGCNGCINAFVPPPDSRSKRSGIDDVGAQSFSGKGKGRLDRLACETGVSHKKLLNGFAGGKLFNDEFDGNSCPSHDGFPHHDGWIRLDQFSCTHGSLTDRP